jgi:hypothetical protein
MRYLKITLIFITLITTSCFLHKINVGTFPDFPVNMGNINSEFDDYNSSSPTLGGTSPFCFSTNRNSQGKNFDVIYKLLDILMNRETEDLNVSENTRSNLDVYNQNLNINEALIRINTKYDELGPYLIPAERGTRELGNGNMNSNKYCLLYSSNESGNFDIMFTQNITNNNYSSPQKISFLNSTFDDIYPTLSYDSSKMYFCSNRSGDFDIYYCTIKKNGLLSAFSDTSKNYVIRDTILSSSYEDKCPFIIGNLMIFTSNRLGGFGGFDLYYSTFSDGKWSLPANFGEKINSKYDEYRPIIKEFGLEFTNDFMIFSSNRSGGKGGFDLYYVGIKKMIKY